MGPYTCFIVRNFTIYIVFVDILYFCSLSFLFCLFLHPYHSSSMCFYFCYFLSLITIVPKFIGGTITTIAYLFNYKCRPYYVYMCLLSFSTAGMQKLLNICDQYSNDHDLIYNSKNTMCMCFTPKSCKSHECKLSLNQESLSYVREARYLGVVIQSSGTDKDVHRQMRKYYAGINTLIRRFYACSYDVNCYLFRSYISNMYCGPFWFNSTKYCLNKLRVSYNNSCRRLLGLPMRNSASGMFVQCNLLSFGELSRKSIYAFRGRIQSSDNTIIKCMVNSVAPLVSNVWKWWRTTLYTGHVTV